jgi:protein subunit release factor B
MLLFPVTITKQKELEERMRGLGVKEDDFEEHFIRASGRGGQKINKSSSCVHLLHIPTGLAVKCQQVRSQAMNRFYARRVLLDKIERMQRGIVETEEREIRRIRRQKQKRRRQVQEKLLADKRKHGADKRLRGRIHAADEGM